MRRTPPAKPRPHFLEPLESRLLLSVSVAANGKSASYTDSDGDLVTVKISAGLLNPGLFTTVASGLGELLQTLDLSGGGFDHASLSLTVKKVSTGDGLANVAYINSTDHDLGAVSIAGDLGRIDAGDILSATPAVKSLSARSIGRLALDNQPGGTFTLISNFNGSLGSLSIKSDIVNAFLNIEGTSGPLTLGGSLLGGALLATNNMGLVKIAGDVVGNNTFQSGVISSATTIAGVTLGGSLIGGSGDNTGQITSALTMGPVNIKGNMVGAAGENSGSVVTCGTANITSVTVGGSLFGGSAFDSGTINAVNDLGPVKIAHDVLGGSEQNAGSIECGGVLTSVSIGGSLVGGVGPNAVNGAQIFASLGITSVKIAHDIIGGSGQNCGAINSPSSIASISIGGSFLGGTANLSGHIEAFSLASLSIGGDFVGGSASGAASVNRAGCIDLVHLGSLTVGGSLRAGTDNSTGTVTFCGAINVQNDIGTITVKGGIFGTVGDSGDIVPFIILANGQDSPVAPSDIAINSIKVAGSVEHANILAGFRSSFAGVTFAAPHNGDAQIGAVSIGGDFIASNIIAGAQNTASTNLNFGDSNDASFAAGNAAIISSIASITIAGEVYGSPDTFSNTDHFGFVAQSIKSVKIAGASISLNPATDSDNIPLGPTSDFAIHEV